jgi:predicted negative regulator of RcsB-dependent stress response
VRSTTRHRLKQDQFAASASEAIDWTVEHREKLIYGGIALIVVLLIGFGAWWYFQQQDEAAGQALGHAIGIYSTPLTAAGQPPLPGTTTFATAQERAKAAKDEFKSVADKYGRTNSGKFARYFLGLTDMDLNNMADAERELKDVADSGNADTAALAKMALASLYRRTGKDQDAIKLYRELADKPTNTVAKSAALLEEAATYEVKDPTNAKIVYQQIQKEDPKSAAAEVATQKLAGLK